MKPFSITLAEMRDGEVSIEMSRAMHEALAAVEQHNKEAKVTLTLTVRPIGNKRVSGAVEVVAEVSTKLPKDGPPSTLFFINKDGEPSRNQDRQGDLPGVEVLPRREA